MSRPQDVPLEVTTHGKRSFIYVDSGRAEALFAFLRGRSVLCQPPNCSSRGIDVIDLHAGSDVKAVQALLDSWA